MNRYYRWQTTLYNILLWFLTGFFAGLEVGKTFKAAFLAGASMAVANQHGLHQKRPNSPLRTRD